MGRWGGTVTDWVTPEDAKAALGIPVADTTDDHWLAMCCDGVNRLVDDTRAEPTVDPPDNSRAVWGATQLVTRWYSRRNSTEVSAFVELGGPPPSIDRDIEIALEIGRYFRPVVA
jgi:hypothetical protein